MHVVYSVIILLCCINGKLVSSFALKLMQVQRIDTSSPLSVDSCCTGGEGNSLPVTSMPLTFAHSSVLFGSQVLKCFFRRMQTATIIAIPVRMIILNRKDVFSSIFSAVLSMLQVSIVPSSLARSVRIILSL